MANNSKSGSERFERILDGLAQYIRSAPDEELLEEVRAEGRDPVSTAAKVRGWVTEALQRHQRLELERQQQQYEREVAEMRSRKIVLPATPQRRRQLLSLVFSQRPQLMPAFTFQNRGFSDLTDEDIEKHLRKLVLLGVIKEEDLV